MSGEKIVLFRELFSFDTPIVGPRMGLNCGARWEKP
jgi:hypothetical protein